MIAKEFLIFLVIFCAYLSKTNGINIEEGCRKWYEETKEAYLDECKHTISEESLQELDDDLEADNEEIRAFKNCLLLELKYVSNMRVDVERMITHFQKYFPDVTPIELQTGRTYLNICKIEAEQSSTDIDVVGRFSLCAMDRMKSNSK